MIDCIREAETARPVAHDRAPATSSGVKRERPETDRGTPAGPPSKRVPELSHSDGVPVRRRDDRDGHVKREPDSHRRDDRGRDHHSSLLSSSSHRHEDKGHRRDGSREGSRDSRDSSRDARTSSRDYPETRGGPPPGHPPGVTPGEAVNARPPALPPLSTDGGGG